jgi:S1-C subfamily serine protease
MDKSGIIIGGVFGAIAVLVIFAVILIPPTSIEPPTSKGLVVSNGHDTSTVGETTPLPTSKKLSLIEIFERTEAGTVRVEVRRANQESGSNGVGSGFVFDKNGHIITNAHVINDASRIFVTFLDGRSYNAEIIGKDPFTDIAVVKVDADRELLNPLFLGDSSNLKVGEQIAAIGNPFGLSGSMTSGIVSQLGRLLPAQDGLFQIPDVIQTDAAINPGNSGGPLLNMRGEIVGINTAIQSNTGEFVGVGFAIPSKTVAKIVPILIKDGEYNHPWLGISGRDIEPDLAKVLNLNDAKGFLIVTVVEDSPAAKAGLHGSTQTKEVDGVNYPIDGDIIIAVDGIEVRKIDDILIHLQRQKSVGDEMVLDVLRDGRSTSFILVLEERPKS